MRIFVLTTNQIYTPIILKELISNKEYNILGVAISQVVIPGCTKLQSILRIIKDSGIRYLYLRILEMVHNNYFLRLKSGCYLTSRFAKLYSLPTYFVDDINNPSFLALIKSLKPDLIISIYFNQIIKKPLFEIPRYGCINIHRALLPKYRGPCSAFWQLAEGEKNSGVTIHYIDEGLDNGDIIVQKEYKISLQDTHHTLCLKNARVAAMLLLKVLQGIEKESAPRIPQDDSKATCHSFPTREATNSFIKQRRKMF